MRLPDFIKRKLKFLKVKADYRERDPHVLVLIITKDYVEPGVLEALKKQDYPNFSTLISIVKPQDYHSDKNCNAIYNMNRNRNILRRAALATDAAFFLLLDSDVVPPASAISNLILHQKDFIAGWFQAQSISPFVKTAWPTAIMHPPGGNVARYFMEPEHSVILADFTGLGCALVSRAMYQRLEHREAMTRAILSEGGEVLRIDDSTQFCFDARALGYSLYMNGDVICEHAVRQKTEDSYSEVLAIKKEGVRRHKAKFKKRRK